MSPFSWPIAAGHLLSMPLERYHPVVASGQAPHPSLPLRDTLVRALRTEKHAELTQAFARSGHVPNLTGSIRLQPFRALLQCVLVRLAAFLNLAGPELWCGMLDASGRYLIYRQLLFPSDANGCLA